MSQLRPGLRRDVRDGLRPSQSGADRALFPLRGVLVPGARFGQERVSRRGAAGTDGAPALDACVGRRRQSFAGRDRPAARDAFMPGLDGGQLSKMIKSEMPKVKIVVVTSVYKDSRYKHEALRDFEVDDYRSKPLSPVDLRALLQKHEPR